MEFQPPTPDQCAKVHDTLLHRYTRAEVDGTDVNLTVDEARVVLYTITELTALLADERNRTAALTGEDERVDSLWYASAPAEGVSEDAEIDDGESPGSRS